MLSFGEKCVEVAFTSDSIHLSGFNFNVEIRERVIIVKGANEACVYSIRGGKKKVVYVWLGDNEGIDCKSNVYEELTSTLAQVKHITTSIGNFINIIPSGRFLIDYAVIGEDSVMLLVSGRRSIYISREDENIITIYLV